MTTACTNYFNVHMGTCDHSIFQIILKSYIFICQKIRQSENRCSISVAFSEFIFSGSAFSVCVTGCHSLFFTLPLGAANIRHFQTLQNCIYLMDLMAMCNVKGDPHGNMVILILLIMHLLKIVTTLRLKWLWRYHLGYHKNCN